MGSEYLFAMILSTEFKRKKNIDDVIVWIKLKHDFFGLPIDIYIAVVYIVPENSTHATHDPFGLLQNDVACIPPGSQILFCGDYNAHTSVESDFMVHINEGSDGELADYLCNINSERSAKISAMMEKNPHWRDFRKTEEM